MSAALKKLREYETLVVLNPELADDAAGQAVERLKDVLSKKKATMLREEKWGKRKLSFEVKKHGRGHYFLLHYVAPVGAVEEVERTCRNIDQVIRFLTTLNGDVTDIEAKKAEVEKMVAKRAAERKEIPPEMPEKKLDEDDDDRRDRHRGDRGDRDRDRGDRAEREDRDAGGEES
jgi:small subunit ribosomal protein S6